MAAQEALARTTHATQGGGTRRFFASGLTEEQEERARRIHRGALIFDACILSANVDYRQCTNEYLDGGVSGGILTVAHARHNFTQAMDAVLKYRDIMQRTPEAYVQAFSALDVARAKETSRLALVIGFQDAKPVEDDLSHLDAFYRLGLRVMQLTYNTQNFVGSGCAERRYGGLTHFGRELVQEMNRVGIAIDLSHCSDETTMDAIEASEQSVFFTHSNARTLCHAYGRNKGDDQIRALAARGGVIGVVFRPNFIKRDSEHRPLASTVNDVLDHIEHIVKLVGVDHVGFGSDVCSAIMRPGTSYPPWLLQWRRMRPDVFGLSEVWSEAAGLEDPRGFLNLTRGLTKRGYGDEDIKKILGGNFLRALGSVWKT